MKKFNLSLAVVAALSLFNSANAQSLEEALKAGKFNGEFTVTYEKRDVDTELPKWTNYYSDTAYSVGSFALGYESGVWNNLSLTAKFRAYKTIFEKDDTFTNGKGTGDASERFWETGSNDDADFESLFITYAQDNINVKVGRQPLNTKWLNKTHDAVNANFKFGATNVEAIWTRAMGRVTSRDYRPLDASDTHGYLNKADASKGVYKLGLTHDLGDVDLMAFYLTAPDHKDLVGGQIAYDNGTFGASAQYTDMEDKLIDTEGSHTELKAFFRVAGYTTTIGHLINKDDFKHFGMGTTNAMEEGDKIYTPDARTTYLKINKKFGDLSATLISGITDYDDGTDNDYKHKETTLWLGYPIAKNMKANLGYTIVNADDSDADETDLNQLNLTLVYSF